MADEAIGEAAAAVAAEGGVVVLAPNPEAEAIEAEEAPIIEEPIPAPIVVEDLRLSALEVRVGELELVTASLGEQVNLALETKADSGHEHPIPEDMRIISEELAALQEEEMAPRRGRLPERGWLARKLRGR